MLVRWLWSRGGCIIIDAINNTFRLPLFYQETLFVTQLYKHLKMHGLLEYSYGILGLKCYILIDDIYLMEICFYDFCLFCNNFIIKYLYFISICNVFLYCVTM